MKLEIHQLVKRFGGQKAVSIENLVIENSGTLVLLGGSGSGKSTLLRMMAGLIYPDFGRISINGHPIVFKEKALIEYRKQNGVVFQSWNLFPHLTALENIMLPLIEVQKQSREEAKALSMDLLRRFEMDKHAGKKPYALSGGQSQRVAFIRAIAIQPKLLFLDEPTSALDPLMTAEVLDLILELKKEKKDLVMVTHHHHFAKKTADHILFMGEGRVLEQGTGKEVFEHPKTAQAKLYMEKVLLY